MKSIMKNLALTLCLGAIFALTTTAAHAQTTCPTSIAQITSPAPGSTLPAGAVTLDWCNAGADYFLTVESIPGAHDIFNAVVRVTSVTLGPAGNIPTATNPTTQCIPAQGERIYVTLWTQTGSGKTSFVAAPTVTYTAAGQTQTGTVVSVNAPADYKLDASTKSLTVRSGQPGSLQVTLTPSNGFDGTVSFGCLGLPPGVTCQFNPAQLAGSLDGRPLTATLVVSASPVAALHHNNPGAPHSRHGSLLAFWSLGVGALGMMFAGGARLRPANWKHYSPLLLLGIVLLGLLVGCGGSPATTQPATATTATTATPTPQIVTAVVTASFAAGSQPAPSPTQQVQIQISILP